MLTSYRDLLLIKMIDTCPETFTEVQVNDMHNLPYTEVSGETSLGVSVPTEGSSDFVSPGAPEAMIGLTDNLELTRDKCF